MSDDPDRELLIRVTNAAVEATAGSVAWNADARQLYLDAARVAEARIPGELGTALAGVLALAAERRRITGVRGALGETHSMLALAVAVLALDDPSEVPGV